MKLAAEIRFRLSQSWAPRDIAIELRIGVRDVYRARSEMAAEEAQLPVAREEIRRRAALRIRRKKVARPAGEPDRDLALLVVAERSMQGPTPEADSGVRRCGRCGLMEPHECFRFDARDRRPSDT